MDIQLTLFGKIVIATMIIVGLCSYFLGKRKTHAPKRCALIGALLSIAPPLGISYLVVLFIKKDVE